MKNIQMSLILFWFNMTKNLIKKEDYRSITPYWCNRFVLVNEETKPKEWWVKYLRWYGQKDLETMITMENMNPKFSFKKFDINIMTLGYPKAGDTDRILKLEHKGIEIRTGNIEWGAELGKLYFVIKHGNIINE